MLSGLLLSALLLGPVAQEPVPSVTATDPVVAETHIAQGLALYRRLRMRAARDEFQKAVDADPNSAAAHFYLGYTLYKIGEPTKRMSPEKIQAVQHFERCYALDPLFRPVWSVR